MKRLPFDYAVRNLGRSPGRLAMSVGGSVLVVLLVISSAAFMRGMNESLEVTSGTHNVILLGSGSEESIERSEVGLRAGEIAAASIPGIRERLGQRYVSPEIHIALDVKTAPDEERGKLTVVRGVRPVAFLVHPQVSVSTGRAPEPGQNEIAIGSLVAAKLGLPPDSLDVGSQLFLDGEPWTISGRLHAPHSVMDAEIWMPLTDLQVVAQRDNLSCVVLTLDPANGGDFASVSEFATMRLDLELAALRESEYYSALTTFFAPIRWMVVVTAALIALGGVLGGLNTLYAAFASRVREVGTLQVIGYRRSAIVLSLLQESLLTAAGGALLASVLALVLLDDVTVRFSMGAFGLIVDAPVLATGIASGLLLGVVGAIPPAIRCLRLPVGQALNS